MNKTSRTQSKLPAVIIAVLALLLIFIGIKNGEHLSYFNKAVMVCTQCIGLG
ncbi:MAG: CD1871A family CXXC motif-containing protein [Candidatus Riflebacteria bacterium]|nr:CD1871A family CXXC motif-containing protein [Candidatus Riflebacteria bacterium]